MIQARNYTPTNGRQIDVIVLHDMEAPETPTRAENVAGWFAGANVPKASAHWCFDNDSAVRCVRDQDVAWHAPGCNHNGLGYELAGYATQTRGQWLDTYGRSMLALVADQLRIDTALYAIPLEVIDAAGLKAGRRGITIHRWVSEAFRRSTHWDVGYNFPLDHLLDLVASRPAPQPAPGPIAGGEQMLRRGSHGEAVRIWQGILIGAAKLPVGDDDGVFGPQTEHATRAFQRQLGVADDGIVGPATHAATARLLAWLAAQRPSPAVPPFLGTVRRGDRGAAVKAVQARLRSRGWRIDVDGIYGPATEQTVRAFQREKRLSADGIAGPATWRALWTTPTT